MTDSRTVTMLLALCAATFVVTSSGWHRAVPGDDRRRSVHRSAGGRASVSVQALVWGTAALVAGVFSDRFGRRGILVAAVVLLGATRLGFATSHSYAEAVGWQVVSGLGGGAFMGTVYATVSDHVPPARAGAQ